MKTYKVCINDYSEVGKGKYCSVKYVKGISAARSIVPIKLHYSRNTKTFYGHNDKLEYYVISC